MDKEALKAIAKARVAMVFQAPFFGFLALELEPVERLDLPFKSMGTDGTKLYYDPEFVKKMPLEQLATVIAHEILHIILMHIPRRQGREAIRWNFATDFAANALLVNQPPDSKGNKFFVLPPGCLYNPKWNDKTADYIYTQLPESALKGAGNGDDHSDWDKWEKDNAGSEGDDKNNSGSDRLAENSSMEAKWRQKVATAATQARMRGKLPGNIQEIVDEVTQPKLDWKAILRDMIVSSSKSDFRLFPPNKKHLWRGFVLPSLTGTDISIGAAIDTSGSISAAEIAEFIGEIKGICDTYEEYTIYLYAADAAVQQKWELHTFDELPREFKGRGGTDFRPAIEEAKDKEISCFVYLTDGCGPFPENPPPFPVIWVLSTDVKPPFGQAIYLPARKE